MVTGHPGSAAVQGARWGAKPRQGSNPKEAKLRQAECKTELQQVELVQTSTEKNHGKRNFQNLNAFFVTFPSYMHWAF